MDDKKKQAIRKQAVLEFLYATAAQSVAHAALVLINRSGDHAEADKVLEKPLRRGAFSAAVKEELQTMGAPDVQSADVAVVEHAATNVGLRITQQAVKAARKTPPKVVVVELPEGMPTDAVPVLPKSNAFGSN
jgi:hypothetical protein